jgi:PmbA protein
MKSMFRQIAGIGTDTLVRGTRHTGSILIESMTVAGS